MLVKRKTWIRLACELEKVCTFVYRFLNQLKDFFQSRGDHLDTVGAYFHL